MSKTPILLLGATGYLGGSVLSRLLAHPKKDIFDITVLVRSAEKARKLESFGVKTVTGSLKDTSLLEKLAESAHVLFSCADCNDLDAANAFLTGLKKRHASTGDVPVVIHTSGTGVFIFGEALTRGLGVSGKIFHDDDPDDIERSVPSTAHHRHVDTALVAADKEGYVKTYIILPSIVWGIASNPLVDAGIANPHTQVVLSLIQAALDRGQAGTVGKGQAVWPNVNIEDQADLYIILHDAVLSNPDSVGHGSNGYYVGENGDHIWYDVSKAIGKALVKRGLSKSDEPTTFADEELIKYWGSVEFSNMWGSNSRARGGHSRSLGWKPKLTTKDFFDSIDAEVEVIIRRRQA
ncbi:hypothetical protein BC629DRAFT_530767 [Irpex lacteus]|nr:hypothetical protein BC629DRAFT_530767 [Irpex lacteus]